MPKTLQVLRGRSSSLAMRSCSLFQKDATQLLVYEMLRLYRRRYFSSTSTSEGSSRHASRCTHTNVSVLSVCSILTMSLQFIKCFALTVCVCRYRSLDKQVKSNSSPFTPSSQKQRRSGLTPDLSFPYVAYTLVCLDRLDRYIHCQLLPMLCAQSGGCPKVWYPVCLGSHSPFQPVRSRHTPTLDSAAGEAAFPLDAVMATVSMTSRQYDMQALTPTTA